MLLKKYCAIFCLFISCISVSSDFGSQSKKYASFTGTMHLYKQFLLDQYKKNVSESFDRLLLTSKNHLMESSFTSLDMTSQESKKFMHVFTKELYRTFSPEFKEDTRHDTFICTVQSCGMVMVMFEIFFGPSVLNPWARQIAPFFMSFLFQSALAATFLLKRDFLKKQKILAHVQGIVDFHINKKNA